VSQDLRARKGPASRDDTGKMFRVVMENASSTRPTWDVKGQDFFDGDNKTLATPASRAGTPAAAAATATAAAGTTTTTTKTPAVGERKV